MTATLGGGPGDTGVFGRRFDAIDRAVELGTASGRLISVSFPEALPSDADGEHALLDRLHEYLGGAEDDFADVAVAITVPTDQRSVLESVRNVPYGESVDLARVAKMTAGLDHEDESDLQTARQALRANPVPIVVPDHRVRRAEGATPEPVAGRLREIESL
ncbi:MGMT family protein [Halobaculum gomorrense]|uniref:Methylated-DNA-[protein]-cysteine S-methyltransferase n=1 Tax=Halobaculum gomorrense TaxID=43928 RepID=A0A1M5KTC1_9EURY|nr:MGMT family protein [Halobaculum gomorrense]SHG55759.1 methylated-DNA-[protein]-cysteine S-methyltransferase [Halobaculum gomorrense]